MQVEVLIDPACTEPKITIRAAAMTEEVAALVSQLTAAPAAPLIGMRDEKLVPLDAGDIIRIYGAEGKVFAATPKGDFALRLRLYELEERLDPRVFVRISNGEIINMKKVVAFDLSLTGTICVSLQGGGVSYVSRRYVKGIKQVLGI